MHLCLRDYKRITAAALCLLLGGSVAGCGASSAENQVSLADLAMGNSKAQVRIDYEVPVQIPGIWVDQVGYESDSEKIAVFCSSTLPESFSVIELDTGKEVYKGEIIKPSYDEESKKTYGIGRFGDLKDDGKYYIFAETIGESYSFSVGEGIYTDIFDTACKNYYINRCGTSLSETAAGKASRSACHTQNAHLQEDNSVALHITGGWHMDEHADRDCLIGSKIVDNLLMAYELNPESFLDDTGILESGNEIPDILDEARYEVDWLLKMQDAKTGAVYGAAVTIAEEGTDIFTAPVVVTPISMDATIYFAAALSRFSIVFGQFDEEYATIALKAADRAFTAYISSQDTDENYGVFMAAAQLYRATGNDKYKDILDKFFSAEKFWNKLYSDENIFLGAVTYLSTNQAVDTDVCGKLMKALMRQSEDISQRAKDSYYQVADTDEKDGFADLLRDMRSLSVVNHIIYNHEYTTIIEDHVHYLMGMNKDAVNYITGDTEHSFKDMDGKNCVLSDPLANAMFVIMMSAIDK